MEGSSTRCSELQNSADKNTQYKETPSGPFPVFNVTLKAGNVSWEWDRNHEVRGTQGYIPHRIISSETVFTCLKLSHLLSILGCQVVAVEHVSQPNSSPA